MDGYRYPSRPHRRKHGPRGYRNLAEFQPWLRDEFTFRCVYCLEREQWVNRIGHFDADHFHAVADRPDLALDYDNLLYACQACNLRKGKQSVANPLRVLLSNSVRIRRDGSIHGRTPGAKRVIELLRLDSPSYRRRRRIMLEVVRTAAKYNRTLYLEMIGFPEDLPDLVRLDPPGGNSRPNGMKQSYHAQQARKRLPKTY
jgi:hypothetical protein